MTWTIYISFHSPFLAMLHIQFGFDWQVVSEKKIYEYYAPEDSFSININLLSICIFPASFTHLFTFYLLFPYKCMDNLCWPCHKISQGYPKVMIYNNVEELLSLMRHAMFQSQRPSGSGEEEF